jgi:D-glycero-D-manno-heptose 1,7-bisphosphate phosphatase
MEMNKVVFLDRDGTINEEMGYINHRDRFRVFDFVPEAIRILNALEYKVIVLTNQSGIAKGYFTEEVLTDIHEILQNILKRENAKIDKIYYCPHHPTEGKGKYRTDCDCRKPKTGMIEMAERDFNIDKRQSFIIGDRFKDMELGKKSGLKTIFVLTGYGKGEYTHQRHTWPFQPDIVCKDLLAAAQKIKVLS